MKKAILTAIFFLMTIIAFSQKITSEQSQEIYNLSYKMATALTNSIAEKTNNITFINSPIIYIRVFPTTNAGDKTTILGTNLTNKLIPIVQNNISNPRNIHRFDYQIISSNENKNTDDAYNFDLKLSYILNSDTLIISKADLISADTKISLPSFRIIGNTKCLLTLDKISENVNFDNIFNIKQNNDLFDSLVISSNDKKIKTDKNIINLNTDQYYNFRLYLKSRTFLYIFYYEPDKSLFTIIYPDISQKNRQTTYFIKDINKVIFNNVREANLKIIVSGTQLKINEVLNKKATTISGENAEIILKELQKNTGNFSTKDYELKFNN